MFNDIWIARKNAMSLAKTLMVATMVIAIGTHYAVITADPPARINDIAVLIGASWQQSTGA